jgi:Tol biopolymer transport system component
MKTSKGHLRRSPVLLAAVLTALLLMPTWTAAANHHRVSDGRLAVADFVTGQLFALNPDGSGLVQLTHTPKNTQASNPVWSPNGGLLAFDSNRDGPVRLYTMFPDGTHKQLVFRDKRGFDDSQSSFYPDGDRLAFTRCDSTLGACVIASVRLDGTGLRTFSRFSHDIFDTGPSVSPDGRHLAFVRFNAGGIQAQVYVGNADGSDARPVTSPALQAFAPQWSPDGRRLLVNSNCCRLGGDLYVISLPGQYRQRLTRTPYPLATFYGTYSPSGRQIAFASNRDHPDRCCNDLFLTTADGRGQVRVPTTVKGPYLISWAPSVP